MQKILKKIVKSSDLSISEFNNYINLLGYKTVLESALRIQKVQEKLNYMNDYKLIVDIYTAVAQYILQHNKQKTSTTEFKAYNGVFAVNAA